MDHSLKDRVLEISDIVEVIGERVALTRKGKDFVGLCPFHPDRNPSMSVSPKKQIFKCWSCGAGGDVFKFVQLRERVEFPEALALLARRAGLEARPDAPGVPTETKESLRRVLEWAREHFVRALHEHDGRAALEYARGRGLSEDTLERERIGFAAESWDRLCSAAARVGISPDLLESAGLTSKNEKGRVFDRFRNRLMFPIADGMGRPVAFGGRTLGSDPAKYLNSPESPVFSKSRILYGLDLAKDAIAERGDVIVVEGYLDAVLLRQYGFGHVVATLGTALTDTHVKLLKPLTSSLTFCFDSDAAGVKAADRAVETALKHKVQVRVVALEGGKDPADLVVAHGPGAFSTQLQSALDALEFKWRQTFTESGPRSANDRRAATDAMISFIASACVHGSVDILDQGLLVSRLADVLALPTETVHGLLARAQRDLHRSAAATPTPLSGDGSAYDAEVRSLPPGLVAAVEEMFALMIEDPTAFGWADDTFAEAVNFCEHWRAFDGLARDLHENLGKFSRADLLERCEDAVQLDLIARVSRRGVSTLPVPAAFDLLRERLVTELDALHVEQVRGQLRGVKEVCDDAERQFRSVLDAARRQGGFSWNAASGVNG